MTLSTKTTIKAYFETSDKPTQGNFADFIDSCVFLQETSSQALVGSLTVGGDFGVSGNATIGGTVSANTGAFNTLRITNISATTGVIDTLRATTVSATTGSIDTIRATTVSATTISPVNITGTNTNNNAAAGSVGEYISQNVDSGSAVSLVTLTAKTVTSISLSAGDWDVCGNVCFVYGGTATGMIAAIHTTTDALPTAPNGGAYAEINASLVANSSGSLTTGVERISIASTTTIYLIARGAFSTSTMTAYGFIGARRVR